VAELAFDPQETVLQASAAEISLELALDVTGQAASLQSQVIEQLGIVLLDELIEQRFFRAVAEVARREWKGPGVPAGGNGGHLASLR
jgi:hypothetical protein